MWKLAFNLTKSILSQPTTLNRPQPIVSQLHKFSTNAATVFAEQLKKLNDEKISEPENSLELIFAHVLQKDKLREVRDDALKKIKLNTEQIEKISAMCDCRLSRMPVQYILGEWEFRDLHLKMRVPVFIPRPETEELCELVLQQLEPQNDYKILEIGCGSGCISLSLLHSQPNISEIVAIDQSKSACELTMENAQNLGLSDRLRVFRHKLVSGELPDEITKFGPFDFIISNPPYVPSKDILKLEPEIYLYEDMRALDGGPEGINCIRNILKVSANYLKPEGSLWLEVDSRHPEIIKKITENFYDEWKLKFISSYQDIFKKDRFVEIEKDPTTVVDSKIEQ